MTTASQPPVLITGGAGYIGSHAMLALLDSGRRVVVVDDLSTGRRGAVPGAVPFYQGKVGNRALIGRIIAEHGCRAVMHFAGSIIVPESVEKPLDYYQNNVVSSAQLLRACQDNGIENFIFSSTAAVYDGNTGGQTPLGEDAGLDPARQIPTPNRNRARPATRRRRQRSAKRPDPRRRRAGVTGRWSTSARRATALRRPVEQQPHQHPRRSGILPGRRFLVLAQAAAGAAVI